MRDIWVKSKWRNKENGEVVEIVSANSDWISFTDSKGKKDGFHRSIFLRFFMPLTIAEEIAERMNDKAKPVAVELDDIAPAVNFGGSVALNEIWQAKCDGTLCKVVDIEVDDYDTWIVTEDEDAVEADRLSDFFEGYEFVSVGMPETAEQDIKVDSRSACDSTKPKAVELLETSAATLIRCGKKYDSTGNNSERVMDRIVNMFNAATGHELSEAQGNIFMVCLKVVRSETSTYHDDDHYIDGVNYFAMAGEASSKHYKDGV